MLPAHTAVEGPESVVGVAGILLSARVLAVLFPQAFCATTDTLPLVKSDGFTATVMVLVLDVPVRPEGSVQL